MDLWNQFSFFSQYFRFLFVIWTIGCSNLILCDSPSNDLYKIEGKVSIPFTSGQDWLTQTRVLVDGGDKYLGFIRNDGSFVVNNIPHGSYLIQVENPTYMFEPARVDITSKGKIRARKMNNVQTSSVQTVPYPLRFKARAEAKYFQKREEWRITDMLMNPMVLMMVMPVLLLMVLPKMMNTDDPETKEQMKSMQTLMNPKSGMEGFDMSQKLTSLFGGTPKKPVKKHVNTYSVKKNK